MNTLKLTGPSAEAGDCTELTSSWRNNWNVPETVQFVERLYEEAYELNLTQKKKISFGKKEMDLIFNRIASLFFEKTCSKNNF